MANDHFSKQADIYARYRPDYPAELYDFIFSYLHERNTAWDCGTGPGKVASYLAQHFSKVYATDISKEQLKRAPERANVEYLNVSAEDSGFPPDLFDLITVAQAIHWFDFDRFYGEVNRTATAGALLAIIGYGMIRIDKKIDPLLDQFYNYVFGEYFSENRKYINKQYQTIPFPFQEIPSPKFSISYDWGIEDLKGYLNSWSAIQQFKDKDGFNPAESFLEELKSKTGWSSEKVKEVTFPVFLRLGRIGEQNS